MICAAPVGVVFAPNPAPSSSSSSAAAIGYRRRRIRCAAAGGNTLYDVLGLRAGATVREIKAAYRRLARERHPDVAGGADEFVRLHDAYATLSDPDTRARYDRDVFVAVAAMSRGGGGGGAYHRPTPAAPPWYGAAARRPRRTWETDQCW
uniref:J domain-containing protein n=1 Tax=Leersia perrieri TaxID=77586 RepID=A0A0D9XAJ6_9ORYZ